MSHKIITRVISRNEKFLSGQWQPKLPVPENVSDETLRRFLSPQFPAMPSATRTLPPVPARIASGTMGLWYESWPCGKQVALGYWNTRKELIVEGAGGPYGLLPSPFSPAPGQRDGTGYGFRYPFFVDGWQLREMFLSIRRPEDAVHFLTDTGPFFPPQERRRPKPRKNFKFEAFFSDVVLCQQMISELLTGKPLSGRYPAEWPVNHFEIFLPVINPETAYMEFRAEFGIQAVLATVALDRINHPGQFRVCARNGCPQMFKSTDPRKIYHDILCARAVASQQYRNKKREKNR
jgi:hypothetical protein